MTTYNGNTIGGFNLNGSGAPVTQTSTPSMIKPTATFANGPKPIPTGAYGSNYSMPKFPTPMLGTQPKPGNNPGLIQTANAQTTDTPAIKKQTVTEYHPPATPEPQPMYDAKTGQLTDYGKSQGAPDVNGPKIKQGQGAQQDNSEFLKNMSDPSFQGVGSGTTSVGDANAKAGFTPAPYYPATFPGVVSRLSNQENSGFNQATQGAVTGLLNSPEDNKVYADRAKEISDRAGADLAATGIMGANTALGYRTTGLAPIGEGNALAARSAAAERASAISAGANMQLSGNAQGLTAQQQAQSGLSSAGNLAQTGQGTAQSALNSSAGFIKPEGNTTFFGSPLTGGIVGAGGGILGNALNSALKLYKSSGNPDVAFQESGLSAFGSLGQAAFTQAIQSEGSGYNPVAAVTSSNTNAQLGAQYQKQAADLGVNLQNLDNAGAQAKSFLDGHPQLNSAQTPVGNAQIQKYLQQVGDPAAISSYNAILSEIQRFQSAITSSGSGLTPTATTNNILSQDPTTMSAPQLASYIQTLKQLGQSQQAVLQGNTNNAYYNHGAYSGTSTNVDTSNVPTPGGGLSNINLTPQQTREILGGLGISAAGMTEDVIQKFGSFILGALTKAGGII